MFLTFYLFPPSNIYYKCGVVVTLFYQQINVSLKLCVITCLHQFYCMLQPLKGLETMAQNRPLLLVEELCVMFIIYTKVQDCLVKWRVVEEKKCDRNVKVLKTLKIK